MDCSQGATHLNGGFENINDKLCAGKLKLLIGAGFFLKDRKSLPETDIATRTGLDIQQGLMELFTGSVRSIRNPHAHEKIYMDKIEAIHKLHLASLLMLEIDKATK